MKRLFCVAVSGLLLLVGACGDDDDDSVGPAEDATEVVETATAEATAAATHEPATPAPEVTPELPAVQEYTVPAGSHPHDVAVTEDGLVWYTGQRSADMGLLDPATGEIQRVPLGPGSSPHGVIVGPDGAAWITDMGLNAIVRVDGESFEVTTYPLDQPDVGPHTGAFAPDGTLWFTASAGYIGRMDIESGVIDLFDAPRGNGPYGITATPDGEIYFASLGQSYVGHVDPVSGEITVLEPPTPGQGARRVWSDSEGRIWVSEWNAGQLARYDPADGSWQEWRLPGDGPMAYAVYVDEDDIVWLSDFGGDSLWSFDPETEEFTQYPLPTAQGRVRQILGLNGDIWGAESAVDKLLVIRTEG